MSEPDYDDLDVEERWCAEQRTIVIDYLRSQKVNHGEVGEWPAWHIAPCVSIWVTESLVQPGALGWWVICGDLPIDYISSSDVSPPQHPRKAIRAIAKRWLKMVEAWRNGGEYEGIQIAGTHSYEELAPLLETRATLLSEWADNDSLWEER